MKKDKSAKKAAKKLKRFRKNNTELCPKCKHPGYEHGVRRSTDMFYVLFSRSGCAGTVEERGEDGLWYSVPCDCKLTPDDVILNITKGASALDNAQQFLSSMKVSE